MNEYQYRDYGYPSSVIAQKPLDGILDFAVQTAADTPGSQFELQAVGVPGAWGRDLDWVRQFSKGAGFGRVPKDAPAGAYQIVPLASGDHFVALEPPGPMVLYAPGYWHLPDVSPGRRVYFKVSDRAQSPRIQFEGLARLFDPSGELFGTPEGQKGWVDLPADRPGLWSFEPLENRLVRVSNLPPFFAFGSPDLYFEPPIDWPADAPVEAAPERPAPETVFVPGPVEGQTALYLRDGRSFQLEAGPPHPSGDGGRFLPHRAGTIEFFFKPNWHTFDLSDGQRRMVLVQTDASPWSLTYRIDPEGTRVNLGPTEPSHSLYGSMNLDNKSHLRNWYTRQLFEPDQWVHIAWSWGPETVLGPRYEPLQLMTMRIFVNGRGRRAVIFRSAVDALAAGVPQNLVVGPLDATVLHFLRKCS